MALVAFVKLFDITHTGDSGVVVVQKGLSWCKGGCRGAGRWRVMDPLCGVDKAHVAGSISVWIEGLVSKADNGKPCRSPTYFHAVEVPKITISAYVDRINKYARCSKSALVTATIYLCRVFAKHPEIPVVHKTIHRLLIAAVTVAAKFCDDFHLLNLAYAKIGGVTVKEMWRLEVYFLNLLDFKLFVTEEEYHDAVEKYFSSSDDLLTDK